MKNYILPANLVNALNALNTQTGKFCVPTGDGTNYVISFPDDWVDHLNFATTNALAVSYFLVVNSDDIFCKLFIKQLLQKLREESLTSAQRLTLLNTIKDAMNVLGWGDAQVARAAFNSIVTTALWTQSRKDWVLLQLDNYLATL